MPPLSESQGNARRHERVYGRRRHLPDVRQAHQALFGGDENNELLIDKTFAQLSVHDKEPAASKENSRSPASPERLSDSGQCTKALQQPSTGRRQPPRTPLNATPVSRRSTPRSQKAQDALRQGGGSIHLTPSEKRQLAPLLSHPHVHPHIVSFPTFSARLLSKFEVRKSGEGSFSECLLLKHKKNPSDVAVLKIIPFDLSDSASSADRQPADDEAESTITNSTVSAVLREIRILSALSAYHGFAAVRSCHVVRGPWHDGFLEAYHAFRRDHPDLALNPLPSERWDDKMIYGVIEMDNAGSDLETLARPSAFQAYDAFWMTTVLLAVVEMELEFEHRDLHMSNILYREHMPGKGLDISQDMVKGMTDTEPDVLLGLSNLKITIIDYTMSRLSLKTGQDTGERGRAEDDVLFNPDSVWSADPAAEDEEDHQARTGRRVHRLVTLHHQQERQHKTGNAGDDVVNKWQAHVPGTTTLWLAHILRNLLLPQQAGGGSGGGGSGRASRRPRPHHHHVPGSSAAAKKLQTRIWTQLRQVLALLDRDDCHPADVLSGNGKGHGKGGGAVDLLNVGIERGWIRARDVQVFKDRLNEHDE